MSDGSHADFLAKLSEDHQAKLGDAIVNLEDKITDLMSGAPLTDGEFFDLEWAVESRNELRKIIDKEYLQEVDKIVKDYSGVAERATDMLAEYGDFTRLDKSVITQLQSLTFQGFESVGDQYLSAVSKEIYDMTLVGTSFSDAVKNVRATVSGNLKRYADQQVHDGLMQFNANANVAIGKQSGVTKWKYFGGLQDNSRSHCKKHVGKVYTEEEIAEIWSGNWAGKASGDPFVVRGGYRCQHHWRPVFDEEVVQEVVEEVAPPPEIEPVTDLQTKPIKKLTKAVAIKSAEKKLKYKPEQWKTVSEGSRDFYSYPVDSEGLPMLRFRGKGISKYSSYETRVDAFNLQTGKVTGTTFSAETLTLLDNALDITADLSKQYKIPQIRSITPTGDKSAAMSMGDMNLSVNASYWKPRAATAFVDESEIREKIAKDTAKAKALDDDLQQLAEKYAEAKQKYYETKDYAFVEEFNGYVDDYNKKREAKKRLNRSIGRMEQSVRPQTASAWQVGDDLKDRPRLASQYFDDPVDKFNNTVVHEYGHTLHQEYNRIGTEGGKGLINEPPMEKYLAHLFYDKKNKKKLNPDNVYPTGYSEYNHHEWFAESFSLYNMGRKDLVDPKLVNLLDEIKRNDGHLDVFDNFDFKIGEVIDD
jgi:hypothetical protein